MPQCEMCGAEQSSLTTTKVEGAELELCENCTGFGTTVETQQSTSSTSKYSTSSSSGKSSGSTGGSGGSSGSGGSTRRKRDMFDDMEEVATDYDDRIRQGRESLGLTQEELADELNEKASLIRKLERGDILPSDDVQSKLERKLDVSLTEGADVDDTEWSGGSSGSMTLGDVVKRKE